MQSAELTFQHVPLEFLKMLCAVAEGADVEPAPNTVAAATICAVMRDPQQRLCIFPGRKAMPRSLGSVLGGAVARFLGPRFRGERTRVISHSSTVTGRHGCIAITRDGSKLLVGMSTFGCIGIFGMADGEYHGGVRSRFDQFPRTMTSDDSVLVTDALSCVVYLLSPTHAIEARYGVVEAQYGVTDALRSPCCACGNAHFVVVSEPSQKRLSVFDRHTTKLLRRIDGLWFPKGICFMTDSSVAVAAGRYVAVVDVRTGEVWHFATRIARGVVDVACSPAGEIVAVANDNPNIYIFSPRGDLVQRIAGLGSHASVALHRGVIVVLHYFQDGCAVYE